MSDMTVREPDTEDESLSTNGLAKEIQCMTLSEKQSKILHDMDVSIRIQGPKDSQDWQDYDGSLHKTYTFNSKLNWKLALTCFIIAGKSQQDFCNIKPFKMHVDIDLMNTEGETQTVNFSTVLRLVFPGCLSSDMILEYKEVLKINKVDSFRVKAYAESVVLPSLSGYYITTGVTARYGKCLSCSACIV